MHACESQLVVKGTLFQQVPYFNGRVFLENKEEIGKVDEILGPINEMVRSLDPLVRQSLTCSSGLCRAGWAADDVHGTTRGSFSFRL